MPDQRIQYTEELVGAGHPTKPDTLNRLVLVEHNNDGTHKEYNAVAYLSAAQSLANVTWTKIAFDTVMVNNGNGFDTANNRFVAPVDGRYLVSLVVRTDGWSNDGFMLIRVVKNGSIIYYGPGNSKLPGTSGLGDALCGIVELAAGDVLEFNTYRDNSLDTINISGGIAGTMVSITKV
ncbi:MAG TPA: hypothetical protein ENK42_05640 [Deltaproteobacteria bacterium]|nr:hypothetical protein [Deltaproteobacteria bacterium]